jgi:fumarate reductase flavoprotein subunit
MADDIMRKNGGRADRDVVIAICERSADVIHLLADEVGLDLHLDTSVRYYEHSAFRLHASPTESGAEVVAAMRAEVRRRPQITFVDEAHVVDLLTREGAVDGVVIRIGTGDDEHVRSRRVLLACDGFGANQVRVRQFCPEIAGAAYVGSENNTGEWIAWGEKVGAAFARMSAYQGHSHINPAHGTRLGGAMANLGAIMLNRDGRRFAREDQGYSEFATILLRQPGGVALEIFDQDAVDTAMPSGAFSEAWEAGAIRSAESVEELAAIFQVPPAEAANEVGDYNRHINSGTADKFGRQDRKILEAPFYGALVTGALVHTQGGLRIDARCRVLRRDGSVVDGLYAAGGTAAGISGETAAGYMSGNGLIQAFATGLIAAEAMASDAAGCS